ncbi:MAG: hypothetical protein CMJ78_02320 [Planctomycetaceae bacterium]|nr:hypothetical protein [Planctomycetaceae bacterium]
MSAPTTRFPSRFVLPLALIGGGVAVVIWTTMKAHQYYYPNDGFGQTIKEPVVLFTAQRTGRYEIHYDHELGDLTFNITDKQTAATVPVKEFDIVTKLFHTAGRGGHGFHVETPGDYQLSTNPWPRGAEVFLDYQNTQAVARWTLGGIVLGGLPAAFAILLFIAMLRPKQQSESKSSEATNVNGG